MEHDRFPLSVSREPNPLRPYHIPQSTGNSTPLISSTTAVMNASQTSTRVSSSSLGGSARDILPDLDLDLKSTTNEAWQHTRQLLDTLVWRYTSIMLAQPFDVAKTIMQVSLPLENVHNRTPRLSRASSRQTERRSASHGGSRSRRDLGYSNETDDDDVSQQSDVSDDIPDYFTSAAPRSRSPRKRRRIPSDHFSLSPTPTPKNRREHDSDMEHKLRLKRIDSINHVLSALYTTSGAVGWWKATNCTFLYTILLRTTDSFIRGLLLAILGLPDIASPEPAGLGPYLKVAGTAGFSGLDISESPNLFGSIVVVGLSSCITGLILAPLDMVRTRLVITPTFEGPRGLVQNLRRLPSFVVPSLLWLPVSLYHTIPQVFSALAPVVLRRQMHLSPELTPTAWALAAFTTSLADLFIRLPLETIVRRAQVKALKQIEPNLTTIIEPAPYAGVWGTVYEIMYREGETTRKDSTGMVRKCRGHGPAGLIRGWRIGFWGVVGVWGAGVIGPGEAKDRGQF